MTKQRELSATCGPQFKILSVQERVEIVKKNKNFVLNIYFLIATKKNVPIKVVFVTKRIIN